MLITGKTTAAEQKTGGTATLVVASSEASTQQKQRANYVCDGTADDVQINAALTQAANAGGGKVFLTEGGFTLTDTIEIPSHTIFTGAGPNTKLTFATSVGDKTMITNNCDYTPGSRHATGNENITIRDMYIDGDKANRGSGADSIWTVGFNTVENLVIENLIVVNGWTTSIRTEFCSYVVIANNRVHNPGDDCIAINEETYHCSCYGNMVSDAGKGGKSYGASNGIEIQDGSRDIAVVGNTIENCDVDGIQVSVHSGKDPCINVAINANTVRNFGDFGISIQGNSSDYHKSVTVANNQVIFTLDDASYALCATYAEDVVFTGNSINTRYFGGRLMNSNKNVTLANNSFKCSLSAGNTLTGFSFSGTLTNIRFDGNQVNNFGWKGVGISGTVDNMHVVNNHIAGCTHGSGSCVRWDSPTSSKCVVNGNYLQGTHWSYDAATSTWNVLASGWTETWNTKDT